MDIEELNAMIPSETVRKYVQETVWTFTDTQKAILLYHCNLPLEKKLSYLKNLYNKTEDEKLQKELTDYLSDDKTDFNEYLEYAFIEVPNPFERGDIIRLVGSEDYGIVETTQKQWKKDLVKYQSDERQQKGLCEDFSDVQIRVVFLDNDGAFSHAHINPIDLELYQPKGDWMDGSPMDKLLLCISDLYRGESSLDELYYFTKEYRKSRESVKYCLGAFRRKHQKRFISGARGCER